MVLMGRALREPGGEAVRAITSSTSLTTGARSAGFFYWGARAGSLHDPRLGSRKTKVLLCDQDRGRRGPGSAGGARGRAVLPREKPRILAALRESKGLRQSWEGLESKGAGTGR